MKNMIIAVKFWTGHCQKKLLNWVSGKVGSKYIRPVTLSKIQSAEGFYKYL